MRRQQLATLLLAVCCAHAAAAADSPPSSAETPARAAELHARAEQALAAGDWASACPLYVDSQALDPSATTQGRIAQCLEREGKLASALRAYEQALPLIDRLDATRREFAARKFPEWISALGPRVPSLRVELPAEPEVTLHVAEQALTRAELGAALRVDPGALSLAAQAVGYLTASCRLHVSEGDRLQLVVQLSATPAPAQGQAAAPANEVSSTSTPECSLHDGRVFLALVPEAQVALPSAATPSPAPAAAAAAGSSSPATGSAEPTLERQGASQRRQAAYALGAAGSAALGVSVYLGIRTLTLVNDAECVHDVCSPEGTRTIARARRSQTAGFILAGVGAAAFGAGVALWLSEPDAEVAPGPSASLAAQPAAAWAVLLSGNGLWVTRTW